MRAAWAFSLFAYRVDIIVGRGRFGYGDRDHSRARRRPARRQGEFKSKSCAIKNRDRFASASPFALHQYPLAAVALNNNRVATRASVAKPAEMIGGKVAIPIKKAG
jgi:hypothetical protein